MSFFSKKEIKIICLLILPIALSAAILTQLFHESVHALTALLVGAKIDYVSFYVIETNWPIAGIDLIPFREALIAGSAAVFNILLAGICMTLFNKIKNPSQRLFVFYLGAYSLFLGCGYLLIDPLRASPDSLGDWAKVVMFLGGSWTIRLLVFLIGGVGTVYGYFWMGSTAQHFNYEEKKKALNYKMLGVLLCLIPYIVINIMLTITAFAQGSPGAFFALFLYWGGYLGFFWAFMIKFVWSKYEGHFPDETFIPSRTTFLPLLIAILLTLLVVFILGPGITTS